MSTKAGEKQRGLLLVFSNPSSPERVDELNQWYDETHLHEVLRVPGVVAATRYELGKDQMRPEDDALGRRFLAIYELESDDLARVRDALMATSSDRTHSAALEFDPLPATMVFRQLGPRVESED